MSLPPEWVETEAPVADVYERVILLVLAGRADLDGSNSYPSQDTMARSALCDTETVKRRLRAMQRRGLIARGDQRLVAHIRKDRRPVVYDVLIPRSWFSDQQWAKVQRERANRGFAPLDPEGRPDIAPPTRRGRATRSDKGKPNAKRSSKSNSLTSNDPESEALAEPPRNTPHGGSNSRGTGALTVVDGGSKRATTSFPDLSQGPPPENASRAECLPQGEEEGAEINGEEATPAQALLTQHARFKPGKFLSEHARAECEALVEQHLAAGWDSVQLGRYVRDWSAQALNPTTWLPRQLRELGAPPAANRLRTETNAKPVTGDGPVPASDEHKAAVKSQLSLKQPAQRRAANRLQRLREAKRGGTDQLGDLLGESSSTAHGP